MADDHSCDVWSPRSASFKDVLKASRAVVWAIENKACVPHLMKSTPSRFRNHWVCQKCGGIMDNVAYKFYRLGLKHGQAASNTREV